MFSPKNEDNQNNSSEAILLDEDDKDKLEFQDVPVSNKFERPDIFVGN